MLILHNFVNNCKSSLELTISLHISAPSLSSNQLPFYPTQISISPEVIPDHPSANNFSCLLSPMTRTT